MKNQSELVERVTNRLRSVPEIARARLRVGFPIWLRLFLGPGVLAITLGRRVYLSPALLGLDEDRVRRTLRHELVHVRQAAELGLLRFLIRYLRDYLRLRRGGLGHDAAYRSIEFEREAFAAEREEDGVETS